MLFSDRATALKIAKKIHEHIRRRYSIDGREFRITASVGLALYPRDGEHCDALVASADASMYLSKAAR